MMRLVVLFCALLVAGTLSARDVIAQNWWQKTQEVLGSDTGTQIIESLSGATGNVSTANLTSPEISAGLRDALRIGTERVVGQLGVANGFNLDPAIRIPLPGALARVDSALSAVGMGSLTTDLELRLNRAAEAATPKAKALFVNAISTMTIDDAKSIISGSNDAATQYLRRTMGADLNSEMQPIIQTALADAGAIKAYDNVMGRYGQIPFMPSVKANMNDYVARKAMDGIFHYVAKEEAAIRSNPAARTTDLLKKVFAN
jgi:hypothetical protein